jgi:outer membrane protein assembly factor BamB
MPLRLIVPGLTLVLLGVCLPSIALAADPPGANGWRGPLRDGAAPGFDAPRTWPKSLRKKWQLEVGEGHASPVMAHSRIYQFTRQDEQEVLRSIGLDGKEFWKQSYDAPYEMHNAARGHGKGPKSTPWVDVSRICTLGIDGALQCRRTRDGKLLWQASDRLPTGSPLYGAATSPLAVDHFVVVHLGKHDAGAFVAFDFELGPSRWTWDDDGPAYTSPVVMEFAGQKQIVTQSQKFCLSLTPRGQLLWKLPFTTGYDQNSVTPVQYKDTVIISGFRKGVTAIRPQLVEGKWQVEEVWHSDEVSMYMSSPVLVGDRLFGFSERNKGQLFCLNAATGEQIWLGPPRQGDNAALQVADSFVTAQLTDGRFLVIDPKADEYGVVAEYKLADTPVWTHPALFGRNILVKDETSLTLWSVE